jgi:hypothetical protein
MTFEAFVTFSPDGKTVVNEVSQYNQIQNKACKSVKSSGRQRVNTDVMLSIALFI